MKGSSGLFKMVGSRISWLFVLTNILSFVLPAQIICHGKTVVLTENGRCNISPYTPVFEDSFDGNSLDTSKWKSPTGVVRDLEHSIAQQWYNPKNVEVSDGTLKLVSKRDTLINACYYTYDNGGTQKHCEDFFFTAGQIETRHKFGYGKIEMSCRIPSAKGVASSFWAFGDPGKNEIDVFEFENETNTFLKFDEHKLARVHNMNTRCDFDLDDHMEDCPTHYKGADFSKEFHLFAIIWTPHLLEWYVDGKLVRVSSLFYNMQGQMVDCNGLEEGKEYILNLSFPKSEMQVIIDNIIQVGKNAPDKDTNFPQVFEIDFVRIYRQSE